MGEPYVAAGRGSRSNWSAPEPRWGLWATPESQAHVFPDDVTGMRAIDLACGTAERVPCRDGTFGLAISEYGASLWCDAYRWIPEAARLLVPGGQLVFVRRSPLFALCAPPAGPVSQELVRPQFGLNRLDRGNGAEFYPPHGELLRSLRS